MCLKVGLSALDLALKQIVRLSRLSFVIKISKFYKQPPTSHLRIKEPHIRLVIRVHSALIHLF